MNDFTPNTTISADDTFPYIPREPWMTDADFQWVLLEERARINTEERKQASPPKALIAIKAQHPLTADGKPGPEYLGRLRQALAVAKELRAVEFMTFGGVHDGSGVTWQMPEHSGSLTAPTSSPRRFTVTARSSPAMMRTAWRPNS